MEKVVRTSRISLGGYFRGRTPIRTMRLKIETTRSRDPAVR
jgi:hypothetical protein